MNLSAVLVISALIIQCTKSSAIINKYNDSDECALDNELIREIASYKNVTQKIMEEITRNGFGARMYEEYTKFIDKFGARPSGTETLEQSIDYMIDLTKQFGLSDVTTEEVDAPRWARGHESAVMVEPRVKNIAILGLGSSVSTPPNGITAQVVVVKSFQELDELAEKEVKGKIVVYDAPYISYGDTVVYRSQGATKAAMKGAVASLVRSVTPFSIYSLHTGAQYYGGNVTKIPTASITVEDADLLYRLQEKGEKIIINMTMLNSFNMKKSRNTIIDLKGKEQPSKLVIVSGHIDSWDVGEGAMDDGGGMIISWFVPVVLNLLNLTTRRTVRAILWTAEEPGLIGAATYLNRHVNDLSNINFIMESDEGTFNPLGLEVAGTKKVRCIIGEVLKIFSPIDKLTESKTTGSDISLIVDKDVPGASLLNENERYYWFHHSEGDTMDIQNKEAVIKCAAFWAAVTYVISDLSQDLPHK